MIAFTLTLSACTSSQLAVLNKTDAGDEPQLFYHTETTDRPFEVIGWIETSGWVFTSNQILVNGLKKKAAKVDADAVIDVRFDHIPHMVIGIPMVTGLAVRWK